MAWHCVGVLTILLCVRSYVSNFGNLMKEVAEGYIEILKDLATESTQAPNSSRISTEDPQLEETPFLIHQHPFLCPSYKMTPFQEHYRRAHSCSVHPCAPYLGMPRVTFISPLPAKWKVFSVICVEGSPML